MADASLQIALVADGDPRDARTNSGVAIGLLEAMQRNGRVSSVEAIDGSLSGASKIIAAAAGIRPTRAAWRAEFTKGPVSVALRGRRLDRRLAGLVGDMSFVIQVRNVYPPCTAPYVVFIDTVATLNQRCWPEWALSARRYSWRLTADLRQFHGAEHIFTAGSYLVDELVECYGLPRAKITPVGAGMSMPESPPMGVSDLDEPNVLFVGREPERKGADLLAAAFNRVREVVPRAKLTMAGFGCARSEGGIEYIGVVKDRGRLAELYRTSSVYCMPARFEPYGLVIVEAMHHGLPFVATDVGAMREFAGEDQSRGILVPSGDVQAISNALVRLLTDEALRRRMGEDCRAAAARYTWDNVASRMLEVLSGGTYGTTRPPVVGH